ncbi:acetate uptake transporter [Marinitoga aeolica]|uniref:Acetate uptake transporter n=1 Tax=Marinitoga aeolica TaxID=2809031 RepID=A0ABY8PU03_9BACT|nr:acetate uptake transporter [Marinitoga aeolica]WGS65993.1 acetate uptake transporter [Marinitoga aeolica]
MEVKNVNVSEKLANPAPLGLMGFGMTTILLNLHNAGIIKLSVMIMTMGIFYGGLAQVIAGIFEMKKNNTFGATAFTSYGFFWLSLVGIWTMPKMGLGDPASAKAVAFYLLLWGIFTLFMYIGTLNGNKATQTVFGSLTILFFLLAIGDFTGIAVIKTIAGWEGIFCGASAFYTAMAEVLNEKLGKTILPL